MSIIDADLPHLNRLLKRIYPTHSDTPLWAPSTKWDHIGPLLIINKATVRPVGPKDKGDLTLLGINDPNAEWVAEVQGYKVAGATPQLALARALVVKAFGPGIH